VLEEREKVSMIWVQKQVTGVFPTPKGNDLARQFALLNQGVRSIPQENSVEIIILLETSRKKLCWATIRNRQVFCTI